MKIQRHFCYRLILLSIGMLPAGGIASPTTGPSTQPASQTAIDAARQYFALMQSHQGSKAVDTYWDVDAMCDQIFGSAMKQQSASERDEMRKTLLTLLEQTFSRPRVADTLAGAKCDNFSSHDLPDDRVAVEFTLTLPSGDSVANTLYLTKQSGGWHVTDTATNGRSMVDGIRSRYQAVADAMTPLQFIQQMAANAK